MTLQAGIFINARVFGLQGDIFVTLMSTLYIGLLHIPMLLEYLYSHPKWHTCFTAGQQLFAYTEGGQFMSLQIFLDCNSHHSLPFRC